MLFVVFGLLMGCTTLKENSSASGTFEPAESKTLTVATSDIPTPGFWEGTAERLDGGFEYELARDLADRLGLDRVKVVEVSFDDIVSGELGGADIALAAITPTRSRDKVLDFTTGYLDDTTGILVRTGTSVRDVDEAQDLQWGIQHMTTFEDIIADKIHPADPPVTTESQQESIELLRRGEIDAVPLDLPVAIAQATNSNGGFEVAAQIPGEEVLAVALPEGSQNLEATDSAIHAFVADGTIDALAAEWIGPEYADGDVKIPLLRVRG